MRPAPLLAFMAPAILCLPARAQDTAQAQEQNTVPTVTVSARKEAVVRELDKTVYDVSTLPRAANGSAQDVLQSTPDLAVTADGRIAVRGNAQVTVLVDGKPTAILAGTADERALALQTMNGADIAAIEVITNPSAAYNANGGAIVNIVLKRKRQPGAHGQVQGSASDDGLWNGGASGDLTRGDTSVHGSLALRHDGTRKFRQAQVDWIDPASGQARQTLATSDVFVRRIVESAALGIDRALGDADSIGVTVKANARKSNPLFDVRNDDHAGAAETVYHRISAGPNEQSDRSAALSYSHGGDATALKATLQHSATTTRVDKSYRDVFDDPARATGYSRGATDTARRLDQLTVDWTRAASHGGDRRGVDQWGAGVDVQDKTDDMANVQASVDPVTGAATPDPDTTNAYAVATTSAAAYVTARIGEGNWEALLGERAELTTLRVRAAQDARPAARWRTFDPSLHLKYALGAKAGVTLNYRRSLQMPDPRDLNPFTTYVDAHDLSRGNPALRPQRVSTWELGANADGAHVNGGVSIFYRASRDTVTDAYGLEAGDVVVTSKQNGGQARAAGVSGTLDWTPSARLRFGLDAGAYRVRLDTFDLDGPARRHGLAGYANLRAAYGAGADEVALDAHVQSAGITPFGGFGPTSSVNLAWKHRLTPTLGLTVNANDMFDGSRRTYWTRTSTLRQAGFDHFVARRVYVGVFKKFD